MTIQTFLADGFLNDRGRWRHILEWALPQANAVEFNVLFEGEETESMIKSIGGCERDLPPATREFVPSRRVRFALSDNVRDMLLATPYDRWKNSPLEDPSLWSGDQPIIETITHEGYVFARLSEVERATMLSAGVDFWSESPAS